MNLNNIYPQSAVKMVVGRSVEKNVKNYGTERKGEEKEGEQAGGAFLSYLNQQVDRRWPALERTLVAALPWFVCLSAQKILKR